MLKRLLSFCVLLACVSAVQASVIYSYDFPTIGGNGSGLAVNQASSQPAGATFSDFTRAGGLTLDQKADIFSSASWALSTGIDTSRFATFTITADVGNGLALSQLTFEAIRKSTGPTLGQVALFLNGSSTPHATYDYTPTGTMTAYTFDFTPLTADSNVTSATFRFYGGGATSAPGTMAFDNVTTFGSIVVIPEISSAYAALVLLVPLLFLRERQRRQRLLSSRES